MRPILAWQIDLDEKKITVTTDNFQSSKALNAVKQGGLKGQGMGEGILKESVPEAHTDYIIAVITEEYGSIISSLVIFIVPLFWHKAEA